MAIIEFLGPLTRPNMNIEITHLYELKDYLKDNIEIQEWLGICAVAVNDTLVTSLEMKIKPNDKISLLPPVCGG